MNLRPQLAPRTEQRLGLVLTPQMRQRIEMLSMTLTDLAELAMQEVVENPILEEADPHEPVEDITPVDELAAEVEGETGGLPGDAGDDVPSRTGAEAEAAAPELDGESASPAGEEPDEAPDPFAEVDFGAMFEHYLDPGHRTLGEYEEREEQNLENRLRHHLTLQEHLQAQIALLHLG
jgi:RNA polymerase sigma-54 factor